MIPFWSRSRGHPPPWLSLALAALLLGGPALAETVEVRPELALQGAAPLQTSVAAHLGDTIRVDLPALAGTGYAWSATVQGDAVQPGRIDKREAKRPGGPTREIRNYLAAATGTARVTFDYQRPWETSIQPARQVVLSIQITEAPPTSPGPEQNP